MKARRRRQGCVQTLQKRRVLGVFPGYLIFKNVDVFGCVFRCLLAESTTNV
jgi:hypothetical protein